MSELINYPFFDLDNLKSRFLEDKSSIGSKFERIIVIGVGGSSQGSKAINGFLNEDRVIYFDHLNYKTEQAAVRAGENMKPAPIKDGELTPPATNEITKKYDTIEESVLND
mgnify:CR=1 FL=1